MVAVNDVNNEVIAVVMAPIEEEEGAAELIGMAVDSSKS